MKKVLAIGLCLAAASVACDSGRFAEPDSQGRLLHAPNKSSRTAYGVSPGSQYGIVFQGDSLNTNANKVRAAQFLFAGGVRFARVTAYWYSLQQFGDNTFTSWELQPFHESIRALIDAGITPYITLEASACFAVSETFPCASPYNPPDNEAHWQAWTTYVQQMMQEFPQVHYWGIWNEPNSAFLLPNGGDRLAAYKELVQRAAPAIHAAGGIVIGPDLGDGLDSTNGLSAHQWLTNFMSSHGSYVDVVAVHHYSGLGTLSADMRFYADLLAGSGKDLWLTEVAIGDTTAGESARAQDLAGVYRLFNSGAIPVWSKTFYFNAGSLVHDFGIVENLGTPSQRPRAAYDSLQAIASQPPATLGISLGGPFSVTAYEQMTWGATAHGGQPPYTYVWRVANTEMQRGPYGSFAYTNEGVDFLVNGSVVDALGRVDGSSIGVTVQWCSAPCS